MYILGVGNIFQNDVNSEGMKKKECLITLKLKTYTWPKYMHKKQNKTKNPKYVKRQ